MYLTTDGVSSCSFRAVVVTSRCLTGFANIFMTNVVSHVH